MMKAKGAEQGTSENTSDSLANTHAFSFRTALRRLLPRLLINGVLPFILYRVIRSSFPTSDLVALSIAAVPALLQTVITFVRKRRIDLLGALVVGGFALGIAVVLLTGNARFLLIRESLFHAALGIVCLVSLLFPKPLLFVAYRYVLTGGGSLDRAGIDELWHYATIRSTFRILTGVVGAVLVVLMALRVFLVFFLSISTFLAIAPFIFIGPDALLAIWIVRSIRAARQRVRADAASASLPVQSSS